MAGDKPENEGLDEELAGEEIAAETEAVESTQESNESGSEADSELDNQIEEAVAAALAEQQDMVLRAKAEVQNTLRRRDLDVEKAHKFALEKFSSELITVVDNLERALDAVPDAGNENVKALYEGVELTLKGFLEVLNRFDIQQLAPEGEPFDPQQHEAMSMVENDDVEPNTVLTVIQKGYVLNGRVIRPAMVIVAKASAK